MQHLVDGIDFSWRKLTPIEEAQEQHRRDRGAIRTFLSRVQEFLRYRKLDHIPIHEDTKIKRGDCRKVRKSMDAFRQGVEYIYHKYGVRPKAIVLTRNLRHACYYDRGTDCIVISLAALELTTQEHLFNSKTKEPIEQAAVDTIKGVELAYTMMALKQNPELLPQQRMVNRIPSLSYEEEERDALEAFQRLNPERFQSIRDLPLTLSLSR